MGFKKFLTSCFRAKKHLEVPGAENTATEPPKRNRFCEMFRFLRFTKKKKSSEVTIQVPNEKKSLTNPYDVARFVQATIHEEMSNPQFKDVDFFDWLPSLVDTSFTRTNDEFIYSTEDEGTIKIRENSAGTGTFGEVTLGELVKSNCSEPIAVKALRSYWQSDAEDYDEHLDSVMLELFVHMQTKHPNVIRTRFVYRHRGHFNIAMDYASNGNVLDYLIDNGPLSKEYSQVWFSDVVRGLRYLHSHGIAHRDLKNSNLLIDEDLCIKICDFSFATMVDEDTLVKDFVGTEEYMAPEVLSGSEYNPFVADVWSLGVCLFQMITTEFPVSDQDREYFSSNQRDKVIVRVPVRPDLPDNVIQLVRSMLHTDEYKRLTLNQVSDHPWVIREQ